MAGLLHCQCREWRVLRKGRDGLKCEPAGQRPGAATYDRCHRRNLPLAGGGGAKSTVDIRNFNPYPANVEDIVAPTNASKWRMGFNLAFKGLIYEAVKLERWGRLV